jgi:hypothetical protein
VYHLPPEHALPALFRQRPKASPLRHSLNMQHFTFAGSSIIQSLARAKGGRMPRSTHRPGNRCWSTSLSRWHIYWSSGKCREFPAVPSTHFQYDRGLSFVLHHACICLQSCERVVRERYWETTSPPLRRQERQRRRWRGTSWCLLEVSYCVVEGCLDRKS